MTARTGAAAPDQATLRPSARRIALTLLLAVGSIIAITTLYYALPLDHASMASTVTMLVTGLVVFVLLVLVQVRAIVRSRWPTLLAIESLAISVPFFLLLFAGAYVALANLSPAGFGQHLTHTDGLYFTVTVFSTVGFGDITAKTEPARIVVTVQMLTDLIIYGVAIKVFVRAVRRGQQRKSATAGSLDGDDDDLAGP